MFPVGNRGRFRRGTATIDSEVHHHDPCTSVAFQTGSCITPGTPAHDHRERGPRDDFRLGNESDRQIVSGVVARRLGRVVRSRVGGAAGQPVLLSCSGFICGARSNRGRVEPDAEPGE